MWTWTSPTTATKSCRGFTRWCFPPFSESNLFDALSDVLDRIKDVKGKKAVLVLASGIDTFSRMTLDQTLKRIRETDATIFTVGVGEQFFMNQAPGAFGQQLTYIQAQNQLKTFAAMTGGRSWLPRFDGEIPGIMQEVAKACATSTAWPIRPATKRWTESTAKSKWSCLRRTAAR